MASSQNNKKRRGKDSLSKQDPDPVVFMAPGLIPDVRITVFNQQYQVHSVALKYHSAFFRKFLDSPEKERIPGAREFKYEYVAVVDDDATWALEPAEKVRHPRGSTSCLLLKYSMPLVQPVEVEKNLPPSI